MTATVSKDYYNNDDNHNQLTATTATTIDLPASIDAHHQQPPKVGSPPFTLPLTTTKQHNTLLAIKTQSTATHSQPQQKPPAIHIAMANHHYNTKKINWKQLKAAMTATMHSKTTIESTIILIKSMETTFQLVRHQPPTMGVGP